MSVSKHHVVVVGAGGNIGSHLVPHLARMAAIDHLTLVDPDVYDTTNLAGQDIRPRDVGTKKVVVQARRLREIQPGLRITVRPEPVERVPLGLLQGDMLLACLDSRGARQRVNQATLFLGTPWIDAGVSRDDLLAGITLYYATKGGPCLECCWSDDDYAALDAEYPCSPRGASAAATAAPSSLGALAASLQALECGKRLESDVDAIAPGTRILLNARHHKHVVTSYQRNPACRIATHTPRPVESPSATTSLTLGEAFGLAHFRLGTVRLRVEGKAFARALTCSRCGARSKVLQLVTDITDVHRRCRRCGSAMSGTGFDTVESIALAELTSRTLDRKLAALGLRAGDIVTILDQERERHFVLDESE